MQDLTTDYVVIKARPGRFVWGKVVAWHEVGRYQILEYRPFVPNSAPPECREESRFHVYVDKKSTHMSTHGLESALIEAIAHGCLEVNHARHMAAACLKVLDIRV